MLARVDAGAWLTPTGRVGIFAANRSGSDDITVWSNASRTDSLATLHTLRQQYDKPPGVPNLALADLAARDSWKQRSAADQRDPGLKDPIGERSDKSNF